MVDTTDIEKKSLEAHVELCAERYKFLETKLDSVEEKIVAVAESVATVKTTVDIMATKNNDRLIQWGVGIIGFLVATVAYLVNQYVFK
jgi:threonine dehydrogenase-like Zn-dependent dehydrogenase